MAWFDSHAHPTIDGIDSEVEAMLTQAVGGFMAVGTSVASSMAMTSLVDEVRRRYPELVVRAVVGIHPHDADAASAQELRTLAKHVEDNLESVVGIGECGLDLFYEYSNPENQEAAFRAQIALAKRFDLTLVIHTRDAWEDTFRIFDDEGVPNRLIMHCFVGGPEEARRSLDYGAYLSFSGISTFKNAEDVRQAFLMTPDDRILVETDAPYLSPVPVRGRPNLIANVAITGSFLAGLRGVSAAGFSTLTWQNTLEVFQIS